MIGKGASIYTDAVLKVSDRIWNWREQADKSNEPDLMEQPIRQDAKREQFKTNDRFRKEFLRSRDSSTKEGQKAILKELGSS